MDYKLDPPEPTWEEQIAADESIDLSIERIVDYLGYEQDDLEQYEEDQLRDQYYELRVDELNDPDYGYDG